MSNIKTILDEWSVRDFEDNSSISITVMECRELGNSGKPGIQIHYNGTILNYEPIATAQWVYFAGKSKEKQYLLEEHSWMVHEDQYIKNYLVLGNPLKAIVEVKTRSSKPEIREYELPFTC